MGMSCDAYLYYGRIIEIEYIENKDDDWSYDDWEEKYVATLGITCPKEPRPRSQSTIELTPTDHAILDKYDAYYEARRKALKEFGVNVTSSGYCDEPSWHVYAWDVRSYWDEHKEIPKELPFDESWDAKLQQVLDLMGCKAGPPGYRLTAYYG